MKNKTPNNLKTNGKTQGILLKDGNDYHTEPLLCQEAKAISLKVRDTVPGQQHPPVHGEPHEGVSGIIIVKLDLYSVSGRSAGIFPL